MGYGFNVFESDEIQGWEDIHKALTKAMEKSPKTVNKFNSAMLSHNEMFHNDKNNSSCIFCFWDHS